MHSNLQSKRENKKINAALEAIRPLAIHFQRLANTPKASYYAYRDYNPECVVSEERGAEQQQQAAYCIVAELHPGEVVCGDKSHPQRHIICLNDSESDDFQNLKALRWSKPRPLVIRDSEAREFQQALTLSG